MPSLLRTSQLLGFALLLTPRVAATAPPETSFIRARPLPNTAPDNLLDDAPGYLADVYGYRRRWQPTRRKIPVLRELIQDDLLTPLSLEPRPPQPPTISFNPMPPLPSPLPPNPARAPKKDVAPPRSNDPTLQP